MRAHHPWRQSSLGVLEVGEPSPLGPGGGGPDDARPLSRLPERLFLEPLGLSRRDRSLPDRPGLSLPVRRAARAAAARGVDRDRHSLPEVQFRLPRRLRLPAEPALLRRGLGRGRRGVGLFDGADGVGPLDAELGVDHVSACCSRPSTGRSRSPATRARCASRRCRFSCVSRAGSRTGSSTARSRPDCICWCASSNGGDAARPAPFCALAAAGAIAVAILTPSILATARFLEAAEYRELRRGMGGQLRAAAPAPEAVLPARLSGHAPAGRLPRRGLDPRRQLHRDGRGSGCCGRGAGVSRARGPAPPHRGGLRGGPRRRDRDPALRGRADPRDRRRPAPSRHQPLRALEDPHPPRRRDPRGLWRRDPRGPGRSVGVAAGGRVDAAVSRGGAAGVPDARLLSRVPAAGGGLSGDAGDPAAQGADRRRLAFRRGGLDADPQRLGGPPDRGRPRALPARRRLPAAARRRRPERLRQLRHVPRLRPAVARSLRAGPRSGGRALSRGAARRGRARSARRSSPAMPRPSIPGARSSGRAARSTAAPSRACTRAPT